MNESDIIKSHKPQEVKFTSKQLRNFWRRVDKTEKCWNWKNGFAICQGYGQFFFDHRMVRAHRVSWMIHNGSIPTGKSFHGICVLHKCDNRRCVNPKHLFLGTQIKNIHDMERKKRSNHPRGKRNGMVKNPDRSFFNIIHKVYPGRTPRGSRHGNAKLNESKVLKIMKLFKTGKSHEELAVKFNISRYSIAGIVQRKSWKHVTL